MFPYSTYVIKYTMTWAPLSTCTSYFLLWLPLVSTLENRLKIIRKGGNNHIQVFLQFVNTFFIYSNIIIYSKSLEVKITIKSILQFIYKTFVFCKDLYMYSLTTRFFFKFKFSADNGLKCALNAHDLNFCKFLNHFTIWMVKTYWFRTKFTWTHF